MLDELFLKATLGHTHECVGISVASVEGRQVLHMISDDREGAVVCVHADRHENTQMHKDNGTPQSLYVLSTIYSLLSTLHSQLPTPLYSLLSTLRYS